MSLQPPAIPASNAAGATARRANLIALAASCAWGLCSVPHKTIMQHLDGFSATGLTCLMGALLIMPFARSEARALPPRPKGFAALTFKVALCFTLGATFQQLGYGETSATNAGFLVNTVAVITPLLAWILYRERISAWIWLASLITMAGVTLLAEGTVHGLSAGVILCVTSAMFYSFWTLFVGQHVMLLRRPIELTFLQLLFAAPATLAAGAYLHGAPTAEAILAALPEILLISCFARALAYVLNAMAQQHISASCAAIIVSAESVFGAFFAMLLLGETLTPMRAAGAALILLGVLAAANSAALLVQLARLQREKSILKAQPSRRKMHARGSMQVRHDATHPHRVIGFVQGGERSHGP